MGPPRERRSHPIEQVRHVTGIVAQSLIERGAIFHRQLVDLEQPVDEHPQPLLGGNPPGADMRAVEQAEIFQILHHVAHRRGADLL